jgi:energy-converting hydrogenase Eha subunit G
MTAQVQKKEVKSFGTGSMVQWLGVLCWVFGFVWFMLNGTIDIVCLAFAVAGIFVIAAGSLVGKGFECSACGTKVNRKDVKTCPGCCVRF